MKPSSPSLDAAVFPASSVLSDRGLAQPAALILSATGLGLLPARLESRAQLALGELPGVPAQWSAAVLHAGTLNGLAVWLLEDEPQLGGDPQAPAWARAYPVWLAAAAGASALVYSCAACALGPSELGTLALARDHVNLSGGTPLQGLGVSRLGPLFPDTTRLHDAHLRQDALRACRKLGLVGSEAVFACTSAPALETPAEQRWFREAGADVSVQGLAAPLLAAAHAGLGVLAIGLVVAQSGARLDIARIAAAARALAPALDDLLWELARAAQARARAELEKAGP